MDERITKKARRHHHRERETWSLPLPAKPTSTMNSLSQEKTGASLSSRSFVGRSYNFQTLF